MFETPQAMSKMSLFMMETDAQKAALALAQLGVMHPIKKHQGTSNAKDNDLDEFPAQDYFDVYHRAQSRFNKILPYLENKPQFVQPRKALVTHGELIELDEALKTLWNQVSNLEEKVRRQNDQLNSIRQLKNSLQKFSALDLDLSRLKRQGQFLHFIIGTVPQVNYDQLQRALTLADFVIYPFFLSENIQHVIVVGSSQSQQEVQEVLQSADFREMQIPQEFTASPSELETDIDRQTTSINETISQLNQQLMELLKVNESELETAHSNLILAKPFASLSEVLKGKGGLVHLQGWIPVRRQQEVEAQLKAMLDFPFHCIYDKPEIDELNEVPSLLRHSKILQPFQFLVSSFGIPGYSETDPTTLFSITYILMFGMMFGDVGHGAVIVMLSLFLWGRFPSVTIVGVLAGCSSIVFGFVYGSIFGYEHVITPLWMSPMHDPVRVLLIAVIWGAAFLIVANLLAIRNFWAMGLRRDALYSGKGLAGLMFYLACLLVAWLVSSGVEFNVLMGLILFVPMAVILWYQWQHATGALFEKVLVVFIEGLEQVISTVSGTLSFLRVAAFSLNHVALAAAVFSIAGMLDVTGHWIAVVLGNVFIIVLEGAIVAIQCLRLEYYEGFSRYFTGKGKAFEPMKLDL